MPLGLQHLAEEARFNLLDAVVEAYPSLSLAATAMIDVRHDAGKGCFDESAAAVRLSRRNEFLVAGEKPLAFMLIDLHGVACKVDAKRLKLKFQAHKIGQWGAPLGTEFRQRNAIVEHVANARGLAALTLRHPAQDSLDHAQ